MFETISIVCGLILPGIVSSVEPLIILCRQGDAKALTELLATHQRFVQSIVFNMVRNRDLLEDILQEVFMRVCRHIGSFKGECKFTTWLYRLTVNTTLNFIEKEKRHSLSQPLDDYADSLQDRRSMPDSRAENREQARFVAAALKTLSSEAREIFCLFYFGELSIEEIMHQTGKNVNTIKTILFRSRKAIADLAKKQGLLDTYDTRKL